MYEFRTPVTTIAKIIPEVCEAIYTILKDEYLKMPNTEEEWLENANQFRNKWNFPNCVGAIDGNHVRITAPANSGSSHFNYKGFHSIILMAVADANYKIIYCDVGCKAKDHPTGYFTLQDALVLIEQLSEKAIEARNKYVRNYRLNYARKFSKEWCDMDALKRLLVTSDPSISSLRKKIKKISEPYTKEIAEMFLPILEAEEEEKEEDTDEEIDEESFIDS